MSDRQDKRTQFEEKKSGSRGKLLALVLVAAVVVVAVGWSFLGTSAMKYQQLKPNHGMLSIPVAGVSDGQAHFFSLASGKSSIDFFVLKDKSGVLRAAFDACDVCYKAKKGYRQEGDFMVCNNCNMKFRSDRINDISGGCNPAPLNRTVEGAHLVVAESDVKAGAWYFGL